MNKRITFLIASDHGAHVKTASISKPVLFSIVLSLVLFIACIIYFMVDYQSVKTELTDSRMRISHTKAQTEIIANQQKQIQNFDLKIQELQSHLQNLKSLENKIRLIANLEEATASEPLLGIGGSSREDFDPGTQIKKSRNQLTKRMHLKIDQLSDASIDQASSFDKLIKLLEDKKNLLAATPSIKPVKGYRSSKFGYRHSPFTGRKEFHKGLDIAARKGSKIKAPADGVVVFSGKKGLMGNMVAIDHGYGMITRFGHLDAMLKKRGDKVKRGDIIALVGNTGRSTGPHLHYEVRLNGIAVNPENYF